MWGAIAFAYIPESLRNQLAGSDRQHCCYCSTKPLAKVSRRPQTGSLGLYKQSLPPQANKLVASLSLAHEGGLRLLTRDF